MKWGSVLFAAVVIASLGWLGSAASSASDGAGKSGFDDLKPPAPKAFLRPREIEKPAEVSCNACHAQIVAEWKDTAHAVAWLDEEYREQLKEKKKPESCYGCHIPKPLMQAEISQKPPARDNDRHLGIGCESCHLGPDGAMLGPRGTATSAHPTKKSDTFIGQGSSALCVSCHKVNIGPVVGIAKDFEQAKLADSGKSCVGCHCAEVEQAFANAPPGSKAGGSKAGGPEDPSSKDSVANNGGGGEAPVRKGRSHALQTPRDPTFLARAFEPSARDAGGKTVVSIKNLAGHRVPGLIGRKIELRAEALDAQGKAVAQGTLEIDAASYLAVGESSAITLNASAAKVHLTGVEHDPRAEDPIAFLDMTLSVAAR